MELRLSKKNYILNYNNAEFKITRKYTNSTKQILKLAVFQLQLPERPSILKLVN